MSLFLYLTPVVYVLFLFGLLLVTVLAFPRVAFAWRSALIMIWALMVSAHLLIVLGGSFPAVIAGYLLIGLSAVSLAFPMMAARPIRLAKRLPGILGALAFAYTAYTLGYFAFDQIITKGARINDAGLAFGLVVLLLVGWGALSAWSENKTGVIIIGVLFFLLSGVGFMTLGLFTLPVALLFLMAAIVQIGQGPASGTTEEAEAGQA
jgi:hypothetical protein